MFINSGRFLFRCILNGHLKHCFYGSPTGQLIPPYLAKAFLVHKSVVKLHTPTKYIVLAKAFAKMIRLNDDPIKN